MWPVSSSTDELHRGAIELVERRAATERVVGLGILAVDAVADDLTAELAQRAARRRR